MSGGRSSRALLGLAFPLALLAGCGTEPPSTATPHPTPALTRTPATPSTSESSAPSAPAVVASVAAATPSGTVVFVLVANDGTPRVGVRVTVAADSSNGKAQVTGEASISALGAGETEAAMVHLTVPANDTIGTVTAAASGTSTAGPVNPLTVTSAVFTPDAIEPIVAVTVSAPETVTAEVVAVCYQGTTLIGGGVATTANLRPGTVATLRLAAALSQTPSSCKGFAYRS